MKRIIILLTLVLILLIPAAIFRPRLHLVKGESMEPTIKSGQFILSVIPSRIDRGDVVIVKAAD
jgi:signal peptidase I